jgi:hypothetical protein
MKRLIIFVIGLVALTALQNADLYAQPPHPGKSPVEMMDTDGDGKVSKAEWTAFHAKMFMDMDKDGDGYLSDDELRPPRPEMNKED